MNFVFFSKKTSQLRCKRNNHLKGILQQLCHLLRFWKNSSFFPKTKLRTYLRNLSISVAVTGLLLLVHLLLRYLLLRKMLLGTICYCVIIATIVQMLLRTPKFLKVIHDHNQFKQLRKLIDTACGRRIKCRIVNIKHQ